MRRLKMAVYCEPLSDKKILKELENARSTAIVGCRGCANISLAYLKELPLFEATSVGRPIAMSHEIQRIRKILEENEIKVKNVFGVGRLPSPYFLAPCTIGSQGKRKLRNECENVDAVLNFSCISGHYNISQAFKDSKSTSVLPAMKTIGHITNPIKREGTKIVLEREKTEVLG